MRTLTALSAALTTGLLWSSAALAAPPKAPKPPAASLSKEVLLKSIGEIVGQATQQDKERRCATRVISPKCELIYSTTCKITLPGVNAQYTYEVTLPLAQIQLPHLKYSKGVAGYADHHGLRFKTQGDDIMVVVEGNPPKQNKRLQLALGTDQVSRANALRLMGLLKQAHAACGGHAAPASRGPASNIKADAKQITAPHAPQRASAPR